MGFEDNLQGVRVVFQNDGKFPQKQHIWDYVDDYYMAATSSFLSCKGDVLPFKFLGVRVGDNPRKLSMWRDLTSILKRKLAVWRGIHLNIAGRVNLFDKFSSQCCPNLDAFFLQSVGENQ